MVMFPFSFPLLASSRRTGAPAYSGSTDLGTAPDWYRAQMVALRTSPGSQTITFPDTTWTPKAVRITFAQTSSLNAETAGGSISQGFSDLTTQRCTTMRADAGSGTTGLGTLILSSHDEAYRAALAGAAAGQITLDVTDSGGTAHYMLVEIFGGTLVTHAKVSSLEVASNPTTVVNVGFETNLLFVTSIREGNYPGTLSSSIWDTGFAIQRSGRLRRAQKNVIFSNGAHSINPRAVTVVNVSGVNGNSVSFENLSNSSTHRASFLALGLDPSVDLWTGLVRIDPGTGEGNLIVPGTGYVSDSPALKMNPPFTPRAMLFNANRVSLEGGESSPGNSFGVGTMSALGQFMVGARKPSNTTAGGVTARNDGLRIPDRYGADPYAGTMLGFGTDEANFNATAQQAKTRVFPALLIGSDGVEPTRNVTINPARTGSGIVLSNNNFVLSKTATGSGEPTCQVTRGIDAATANHYFEGMMISSYPDWALKFGVANGSKSLSTAMGSDANSWTYITYQDGTKGHNGVYTAYGEPLIDGDVVGVLLKNGKLYFSKNGVWLNSADLDAETGEAFSGLTGTLYPSASIYKSVAPDRMGALLLYEDQFQYPMPSGASPWGN